jgi:hypothetical protein
VRDRLAQERQVRSCRENGHAATGSIFHGRETDHGAGGLGARTGRFEPDAKLFFADLQSQADAIVGSGTSARALVTCTLVGVTPPSVRLEDCTPVTEAASG